jgi:hypothetical protein
MGRGMSRLAVARYTSTRRPPARWERFSRLNPSGTDSSVDVLVCQADPHHVLLQVWERSRFDGHVIEAAVRLTKSEVQSLVSSLANAGADTP